MRNRRVSSQLPAVNGVSRQGALSHTESVDAEPRALMRSDRLYIVSEPESKASSTSLTREDRVGEEALGGGEISNTVVDADIKVAKWAWAALAIAHCWLIYFMVTNLG